MSYTYKVCAVPAAIPAPSRDGLGRPAFLRAVIEAFQEALELRRAAAKRYLLNDD